MVLVNFKLKEPSIPFFARKQIIIKEHSLLDISKIQRTCNFHESTSKGGAWVCGWFFHYLLRQVGLIP